MSTAVQRTRRRQQREETRQQILDAAQEFLRERSFRELSVDALMSRTGHTRTVFYRHFDDVPSLVLDLIQTIGAEMLTIGQAWAATPRVGPEAAHRNLSALVRFYEQYGPLARAVAEAAHHDEEVGVAYNGLVEGFVLLTTQAIEERVAGGEFEANDPPQLARALVRMLNSYLNDVMGTDPPTDPARVLAVLETIWTRTLFPGTSA